MIFFLGTHEAHWLWSGVAPCPLFVSIRRLRRIKRWRPALTPWAMDSGGFSELSLYGRWTVSPERYAADVTRAVAEIGQMRWAAIQDWMCEPAVRMKTGLSVRDHQAMTIQSCLDLRSFAPEIPWTPVLQGWAESDYLRHVGDYRRAGIDLVAEPVVGVGSVCRREATNEVARIFAALRGCGLQIHGFGVKAGGLAQACHLLLSADSMAWSFAARRRRGVSIPGHRHANCANCAEWAMEWRWRLLAGLPSTCDQGPA